MKNLIIPCAGQSTRYPDMPPKYLLTHPNGGILVLEGLKGLNLDQFDKIYITILKTHCEDFDAHNIIKNAFLKTFSSIDFNKLVLTYLDKTNSQPETVYETIIKNNIEGSIFVKDCDDYFDFKDSYEYNNFVCYYSLSRLNQTNPTNKSYFTTNNVGFIDNIAEKRVISEEFCCGGYSFKNSKEFCKYYLKLKDYGNLYVSHIIGEMIADDTFFFPVKVENYIDWGTLEEWEKYKSEFKTLFIDLDGVLVENSGEFTNPKWGETQQIKENCDLIRDLWHKGRTQIIITTTRSEEYRLVTEQQLKKLNLYYDCLIMNLNHCKRYIINDYSNTNKYPSCEAINLERNSNKLKDFLK